MKIVFNRKMIMDATTPLMNTVSGKSAMTATEGILIEASADGTCILTTFDSEKGTRLMVSAEVLEAGAYILNAQKLTQTFRVMEGETVTLTVADNLQASIESGKSVHRMNALPASDYPAIPRLETEDGFEINQAVLKEMIAKAMFAMANNDQRVVLNGCYFKVTADELLLVSCDSFKLAKCGVSTVVENRNRDASDVKFSFIVPTKTVNELYRILEDDERETVRVCLSRKNIIFHFENMIFFSHLVEGIYIEYDRIIIKQHRIFATCDRERLIAALERAALVTEEKVAGSVRSHVKLQFEGKLLKISAVSTLGSTYDEIEIDHEGDDILIAFNNRFLIESLKASKAERVKISLSTPLTSINIEPAEDLGAQTELFMLLPVRMKE